jgi:hypothetical protein
MMPRHIAAIEELTGKVDKMKDGQEKARLQASLKALGTAEDGNNVFVKFGPTVGGGAGETVPTFNPTSNESNFNVIFDPSKIHDGNDLAAAAAHEGTHVSDFETELAGPNRQPTLSYFSLEYRGYQSSAWAAQALGLPNLSFSGNVIWNSSWATVDRQTLMDKGITKHVVENYHHQETNPHNPWNN